MLNVPHGVRIQMSEGPEWASPGNSHPNRFVWQWVETSPCAVCVGMSALRKVFGSGSYFRFSGSSFVEAFGASR
jgi:hypothetical protein